MPVSPIAQAFLALTLVICAVALWKGGPAERVAALLVLVNVSLWTVLDKLVPETYRSIVVLSDDGLTALGLLAVTLRYGSPWLGAAMLLYAGQFALHAYYFVLQKPNDRFHAIVNNLTFMAIVACLAFGTWAVAARRAKIRAAAAAATPAPAP